MMNQQAIELYNKGSFYLEHSMLEDAILAYKKALEIDPDFAEAHYNLGRVYYFVASCANNTNPDPSGLVVITGSPTQQYKPRWEKGLIELGLALKEFQEVARLQPGSAGRGVDGA